MGCCDKDDKNNTNASNANQEDLDGCCRIRGRRCFCLPYDDPYMITAQVLSLVSLFVSWIWFLSFLISFGGTIWLQVLWCCRQTRTALILSVVVAVLSALAHLGVGIYVLVVWRRFTRCAPAFELSAWKYDDDDEYWPIKYDDMCEEGTWAAISLVCGVLWVGISWCILRFLLGGNHARWEEKHSKTAASTHGNHGNSADNNSNTLQTGAVPVATAAEAPAETGLVAVAMAEKVNDGCCKIRGRRCFCLPYDDPWMITAQVLSTLAACFSWIWWASLLVSGVGMLLLQIAWCCRQNRGTLWLSIAIAGFSGLASIGVGVYVLLVWKDYTRCTFFEFRAYSYDDDAWQTDHCYEVRWAVVSLVGGVLWLGVAYALFRFLSSGRHARLEDQHSGGGGSGMVPASTYSKNNNSSSNNNDNVVELGASPVAMVPVATAAMAETATAVLLTDNVNVAC